MKSITLFVNIDVLHRHYAEVQQYNAGVIDVRLVSSNRVILRDAALWDSC